MSHFLGRYTLVIATIIVFLVLVVGVLGVNFNLSYQTEANAEVVNIAGRQRMLSQRVAKSLANIRSRYSRNESYASQLTELKGSSILFDKTIRAFRDGGFTTGTKGSEVELKAVTSVLGQKPLDDALKIWVPLFNSINNHIGELSDSKGEPFKSASSIESSLNKTQLYIDREINNLLRLMNDLTNHTESLARDAADQSRMVQALGIIASLMCFLIVMYLIFGQLKTSDSAALIAQQETQQIFETVDQGLFLINQDLTMGHEHSKALESIFSTDTFAGKEFKGFIRPLISAADLNKVERYLKLLFDPHKKQRLLKDLNPLNQISVQLTENGQMQNKFLNFSFTRVVTGEKISGVLSSVSDVTKEVKLARELEAETRRNEQQLEMISALMGADSSLLPEFLKVSNKAYSDVNNILKEPAKTSLEFKSKADSMLTLVHKVKGDSSALGLGFISETCHQFENQIEAIVKKPSVSGNEFLSLTVSLEQLISTNEQISSVFKTISSNNVQQTKGGALVFESANAKFIELVKTLGDRQGKKINLRVAGFDNHNIPSDQKMDIISLASQLLRNAVSHGIESSSTRSDSGKPIVGEIMLVLFDHGNDDFSLVCEDDGCGVNFVALTKKAIKEKLISLAEVHSVKPSQIFNLLLSSKLSSKDSVNSDAGRGVGLTVVGEIATKLGAKVSLKTNPNSGSRFTVRISKSLHIKADNSSLQRLG